MKASWQTVGAQCHYFPSFSMQKLAELFLSQWGAWALGDRAD